MNPLIESSIRTGLIGGACFFLGWWLVTLLLLLRATYRNWKGRDA